MMGKQAREVTKDDIIPLEQYSNSRKQGSYKIYARAYTVVLYLLRYHGNTNSSFSFKESI